MLELLNIDLHFAKFISKLSGSQDPLVYLAAACASNALQNGHVCADLAIIPELFPIGEPVNDRISGYPDLATWIESLKKSIVIGLPGDYRPLILDATRLYLHRYWTYEQDLATAIRDKSAEICTIEGFEGASISKLFPTDNANQEDFHKIAALTSLLKNLTIISGGPGTGKTSTVIKILSVLIDQFKDKICRIALAAPTGKAAARLNQAVSTAHFIENQIATSKNIAMENAFTIHRLLGAIPNSPFFKYNVNNPLPFDIVVVDEASMIDLALMAKLFTAIKPNAKLIILGDKDQLSSVEAGAIMGDMCDSYSDHKHTPLFCEEFSKVFPNHGLSWSPSEPRLSDCIVELKKNYRFSEHSGIGIVSDAIKKGNALKAWDALEKGTLADISHQDLCEPDILPRILKTSIIQGFSAFLYEKAPGQALLLFDKFRVLCTMRKGPYGVEAINAVIERLLHGAGLIKPYSPWYPGRPIMVLNNDYNLNLFNGDIGIVMPDPSSSLELKAFFPGETPDSVRSFLPQRLPTVETVFAMTVHKSQGSQFDHILLMLPQHYSPVLSRELIYTGITRAHKGCEIWCNKDVFMRSVENKIYRMSGLREKLWGK